MLEMFKRGMRNLSGGVETERFGLRELLQGRCVQNGEHGAGKRGKMLLRGVDVSVRSAASGRAVRRRLRRCRVLFRQQKGRQRQQVLLRITGGIEKRGLLSKPAFYRQIPFRNSMDGRVAGRIFFVFGVRAAEFVASFKVMAVNNDPGFWSVADNLRKGAVLNAVQIAEV